MASAKFLEEALSTDVDESAVNAIVGSLEDQLVTSGPNRNSSSNTLNPATTSSDEVDSNEFAVSNEDCQNSINSANSVTSLQSSDSVKIVQSSYAPSPIVTSLQNNPMNTSHNNTPTAYINPMQQKANEVKMIYPTTTQALVNQQMINSRVTYPQSVPSGSIGLAPLSQAVLHTTTPVNKTIGIQQNLVIKQAGGGIPAGLVSMPMSVTSSIPGVVTLSKPAGQTTQTISGQPTLLANVPIINMRPPNNPQKTVATVSPRVVLGAPTQMMQSRPSTPGITLQTLPGLPPGQQGHLLLKTENGQYQLLRVGPAPSQNTLGTPPPQAIRLSTVPAVSRPNNQFTAPPLLRKCIPLQQSGVATVSTTGPGQLSVPIQGNVQAQLQQQSQQQSQQQMQQQSQQQSQQQMQQQSQQQMQQQTQHQGIVQNASATLTPVQAPGLAPVSVASATQKSSDNTKEKCRNFLANLLDLSSREPVTVETNVRTLIQELIDNKVEPEQFCDRLERLLKASPQPCLIGFLKKSLPLLRQSLIAKELVIEGIQAPPHQALYSNPPTSQMVSSQMLSQNTMPITSMNIQQNRTMTVMAPGRMQAHNNPGSPVTLQPPALVQTVQSQAMNVHINQNQQLLPPKSPPTISLIDDEVSMSDVNYNPDGLLQAQVRPIGRGPSPSGGKGPSGSVIVPSLQGPTKVINRAQPKPNLHNAGGTTKSPFSKSSTATSSPSSTASSKSGQREKDKKQTAATFAQAYADIDKMAADDDINDVAAMGGVNLAEESQRILGSTEMIGTQIRSCKDEYFLNMTPLQARIKSFCVKRGLEEPSIEVSALISHAVQERLKTVMSKLAVIAEHRIDLTKPELGYEITKDLKSQLKFLEELDRVEKKRREDSEREMLLRAAKSRSKNEDPEQAKLKAKAKELQRVEMEEIRQREANLTALQAIGPRKKPKLDIPNSSSASDQNSGTTSTNNGGQNQTSSNSGPNNVPVRSRLKRVNVRDLIFLLESEKDLKNTSLLYRAYLK